MSGLVTNPHHLVIYKGTTVWGPFNSVTAAKRFIATHRRPVFQDKPFKPVGDYVITELRPVPNWGV